MTEEELGWIKTEFDRCWHWLAAAIEHEHPGTYSREHVWADVESGAAQIWPLPNAVVVTYIFTYPTGKKELRGWLAGGTLEEIVENEPRIAAWAKANECASFVLTGRRGWQRVLSGYREAATFLRKEL